MATVEIHLDRILYGLVVIFLCCFLLFTLHIPNHSTESQLSKRYKHYNHRNKSFVESQSRPTRKISEKSILDADKEEIPVNSVKCETLVQQPQPLKSSFKKFQGTDAMAGDLYAVQTKNVDHLKLICDAIDECAGFNSNGWLKRTIAKKYLSNTDLFIKQSSQGRDEVYLSSRIIEENYGKDYIKMMKELKIYMYDIKGGKDLKSPDDYKYGVEKLFIDLLTKSSFITEDASEAHLYFIPVRCTAYRKSKGRLQDGENKAQEIMSDVLNEIKSLPYWNKSLGSDHFYICAHDMGASVTAKSDHLLWKNSIALVNTADYEDPYYIPHKDIALPPHPSLGSNGMASKGKGGLAIDHTARQTLAFFAGTIDRGRIRPSIQKTWSKDPDFRLFVGQMDDSRYQHYLSTSKFCLCTRGYKAWSPRLLDALWFGCVPVILSDYYDLPLQGLIDWKEIAVFVKESRFEQLKEILLSVDSAQLGTMQDKIKQVYGHLTWNDPPRPYDAFYSVLLQLWRRRHVLNY